jgi:hypothetical protein
MRQIAETGATILVAFQGEDKLDFLARLRALDLPFDFVPAMPCAKDATSNETIVDFVERVRPERMHLLGLGPTNRRTPALLEKLAAVSPDLDLSLDSCLLTANVGRTNGPGGGPRAYTAAVDKVAEEMAPLAWGEGNEPGDMEPLPDYTDVIAYPSTWITPKGVNDFADLAGLSEKETKRFKKDPDGWLQEPDDINDEIARYENPIIAAALNEVWFERHRKLAAAERKRRAVWVAFGRKE